MLIIYKEEGERSQAKSEAEAEITPDWPENKVERTTDASTYVIGTRD